ncbi:Flp family type IVb pilin [Acidovorax sp. Be4]|uniref:Flp family type IVb pilin n=1 Tax=Acidovorax bellezanensis TaxID=2976702 RepID=A0ABT2PNM4_9BURK|nr:Flp family type IVb pilin [Acidovorax sp. Be4]MCT9812080.1 Flp family type IVb pilin [Acidovorax sp. Be4]
MTNIAQQFGNSLQSFFEDEEGAQIIEYALIIAVVSLALIVALKALTASGGGFSTFITKVTTCLSTPASCAQ